LWSEPVGPFIFGKGIAQVLTKHELHKLHQRLEEREQQKAVVEVSATPAKQQTVATEQESMQAEKEDTTQLYIG
jgi:hypothetical protein